MKTKRLQLVTHTHSVTVNTKSNASSPFGPVKAGLITLQTTNDLVLTAWLNCLERKIAELNTKSSTVLDTLEQGTKAIRALRFDTTTEEAGTK